MPSAMKAMNIKTRYDKTTDSLAVGLRPLPSCRTVVIEEDIMLDIGGDGQTQSAASMRFTKGECHEQDI